MRYPKIELHVHFEGTVEPPTLLKIARRNDVALTARNADELAELYRDFAHFVTVWMLTTQALRRADDSADRCRLCATGGGPRSAVRRGDLLARRAGTAGKLVGRGVRGLLRRRPGGTRAPRGRGAADPRHHPQVRPRCRRARGSTCCRLPRQGRRRRGPRRAGSRASTGTLRPRLWSRTRQRARFGYPTLGRATPARTALAPLPRRAWSTLRSCGCAEAPQPLARVSGNG
jgi:hypothetical protein